MPIPVITDHYLAQVVLKPDVNPDANSFVNTWYFQNDTALGSASQMADKIKTVLDAFYGSPGPSVTLASFMSQVINPTTSEYRIYDLGQPAPRIPIIRAVGFTPPTSGTSLPNEVAVCLSYRSGLATNPAGGTTNKRARGRIYLGPLNTSALGGAAGLGDAPVVSTLLETLGNRARDVRDTSQTVTWKQYSRAGNVMQPVTGGFVDNAFDIQRRRGAPPTTRDPWDVL